MMWLKSLHKNKLSILAVSVLIIGILVFSLNSGKSVDLADDQTVDSSLTGNAVLDEEPIQEIKEEESFVQEVVAEPVKKSSKKIGEEGLCEDYLFEQGDELKILDHSITVTKIGSSAIRLLVDGEEEVITEGEDDYLGDGITIGLDDDSVIFFSEDDNDNVVELRVGCDIDENPNEKYVQNRGKNLCEQMYNDCVAVYDECRESFDIDN